MKITSAFSPFENRWHFENSGKVSKNDVVYLTPPHDPMQGMIVGNGDLGAVLWCENYRLVVALNKCDLWDDNEDRPFRGGSYQDEGHLSTLRHCARLYIDLPCPMFDKTYLKGFDGRISLYDGSAQMKAETPFGTVTLFAFVSAKTRSLILSAEITQNEEAPVSAVFERFGSRCFDGWWYDHQSGNTAEGLDGTSASAISENNTILINQRLHTLSFSTAARLYGEDCSAERVNAHSGKFSLPAKKTHRFFIAVAAATTEETADTEDFTVETLKSVGAAGFDFILSAHRGEWAEFWSKSFVAYHDDYLENIWYLTLYFAYSGSRGRYPPHFCNGIWATQRDFMPWLYYFHWNMQDYVWPLNAQNHPELSIPYLNYRFNQLPKAIAYARERKGVEDSAFYADVADRLGNNETGVDGNNTPGSQIALDFWRYYLYTQDTDFLRDRVWPVMRATANYYAKIFKKGADGKYHIKNTQTYEGSPLFNDAVTDVSMARALTAAAVKAAVLLGIRDGCVNAWEDLRRNITDITLVPLIESEYTVKDGKKYFSGGTGEGEACRGDYAISAGRHSGSGSFYVDWYHEGDPVRNRIAGRSTDVYYGIPDPELCAVFPSENIGLKDNGTPVFDAAVNQVLAHPKAHIQTGPRSPELSPGCMGWCPYPIAMARLGLRSELTETLRGFVSTWQCYVNGFGFYGPYDAKHTEEHISEIKIINSDEKFLCEMGWFRHFDNESMPIASCAINESLLQSFDGVIRLFPAVPENANDEFRLLAAGGFEVNAKAENGRAVFAAIFSKFGNGCEIVDPFTNGVVYQVKNSRFIEIKPERKALSSGETALKFPTSPGGLYLLVEDETAPEDWTVEEKEYRENSAPKFLGITSLGLPRMYGGRR